MSAVNRLESAARADLRYKALDVDGPLGVVSCSQHMLGCLWV